MAIPDSQVEIELQVSETGIGVLHTSPDPVFVNRGDRVEWTFPDGPWVVRPGPLSPFGQVVIRGDAGERSGATVREDAMLGEYKALIAVFVDGRVFAADPHFVVE